MGHRRRGVDSGEVLDVGIEREREGAIDVLRVGDRLIGLGFRNLCRLGWRSQRTSGECDRQRRAAK